MFDIVAKKRHDYTNIICNLIVTIGKYTNFTIIDTPKAIKFM